MTIQAVASYMCISRNTALYRIIETDAGKPQVYLALAAIDNLPV